MDTPVGVVGLLLHGASVPRWWSLVGVFHPLVPVFWSVEERKVEGRSVGIGEVKSEIYCSVSKSSQASKSRFQLLLDKTYHHTTSEYVRR